MTYLRLLFALVLGTCAHSASADTLRLYIDGDFSVSATGAQAIELGVRTALAEHDNTIGTTRIDVVTHDHRLNVARSEYLYEQFAQDPEGLAVIGGTYSPPYLTLRDMINARGLLTLLPWSAAGPITRPADGDDNFLFRLSVDDWKAGPFLVRYALDTLGCTAPGLLTTDTGWGRSNRSTIIATLQDYGHSPATDITFENDLGAASAAELAVTIADSPADCVILVSGMLSGAALLARLAEQDDPPRVISHWGILAGPFTSAVTGIQRDRLRLQILQTCGLQAQAARPDYFARVLSGVAVGDPPVTTITDIPSTTGFVHGYDLTLILLAATRQAMETTDFTSLTARERQAAVKDALETLDTPVAGLLATYEAPFSDMTRGGIDAHEALGGDDLCMAQFDGDTLAPAVLR